ncbi:SAM-dependent methyltransferase [Streptomyces sp. DSM 40750]|uniref:SAM-dependent methyltransferase n=1 Tax=Streptomyces sp. DSM 40750 TaxID=2801030 RepID=UPI00214C4C95|nr:SAM-dependent methyltransferase [Streptomyces sp. DSM 40750]UUU19354.1 SAM-dependent methyltransferase [Streptomyces sp. DSM 40750]UUU27302.1 SAM-dependent methyltransferase [Streptomyces sp. DSM 40750]
MSDPSPHDEGVARITRLRTDVSHSARIWNYWLGGKDHYEVDEKVGDQILSFVPELPRSAVADRRFLARAVRFLAAEAGIRQFLDIGTGLPSADNTHEVAQRVDPSCRIVYVDNDPIVLTHAHALLTSTPEGATGYIEADLHDPEAVLRGAAATLDFEKPVAITMLGVLNFIMDTDEAVTIVRRLLDAVPSGSHLVISHPTTEVDGEAMAAAVDYWNGQGSAPMTLRSRADLARLFDGVELLPPGLVSCSRWRPEDTDEDVEVTHFGGVGRKR